ncbi:hypothetical protein ACOSQ2_027286 [Xanthoceras sorbifolium]
MVMLTATRRQADEYVHHYLTKEAYVNTYSNIIHPIPDVSSWSAMTFNKVLPPEKKKDAVEPIKHNRSNRGNCSFYNQFGHNIRTCPDKETNARKRASSRDKDKCIFKWKINF